MAEPLADYETPADDRRRRRPSREVRRLLIEEASRQFTQRGFAATTVKDLSAATGVAISVLYNHFPSKADLLREAVLLPFVDLVDSIGATWASLQDEPGKEAQLIRSFIAELYDGLFEHRGALLTLIAAQAELEESLRNEIARALRRMFLELRAISEEGRARGWHPSERIDIEIRLIVTLVAGAAALGELFLPEQAVPSKDGLLDDMTRFVRYGMSGRQSVAPVGRGGGGSNPARSTTMES
jgi:AcrR family transcriptional regulator